MTGDEEILIAPERFLQDLRGARVVRTEADDRALQVLTAVFIGRADLQAAFLHEEAVDVVPLLAWAQAQAAAGLGDTAAERLAPYRAQLETMRGRAESSGVGLVRFVDPFAGPGVRSSTSR